MATNTNLKAHETNIICGLGTYTHVCLNTSLYVMKAAASVQPGSSLSITISQSGSTTASVTSTAPAASQTIINVRNLFNCVAGDVLTCAISSSAPIDNQANTVSTLVKVNDGTI